MDAAAVLGALVPSWSAAVVLVSYLAYLAAADAILPGKLVVGLPDSSRLHRRRPRVTGCLRIRDEGDGRRRRARRAGALRHGALLLSTSTPRETTSEGAAPASSPRSLSLGSTRPSMELRPMTSSSIKVNDWCRWSRRRWCTSRGGAADGQGCSP